MTFKLSTPLLAALALGAAFASLNASAADLPGKHPAYLHALTDLRDARWNLEHRAGDAAVSTQEDVAIVEIDRSDFCAGPGETDRRGAADAAASTRHHTNAACQAKPVGWVLCGHISLLSQSSEVTPDSIAERMCDCIRASRLSSAAAR